MSDILQFEVVTDPVAKARPRVALRGGSVHAYTPTKTQDAEWRIRTAFLTQFPGHQPFTGPVALHVVARIKMPSSLPIKRQGSALPTTRPDCDNYLKTVMDSLAGVAYLDDSQIITLTFAKRYARQSPPCWEIQLISDAATPHIPALEANHDSVPADGPARLRRVLG